MPPSAPPPRPSLLGRRGLGGAVERRAREALLGLLGRLSLPESAGRPAREPRSILLLRVDRIGDMIVSTPAIRALRRRFPRAEIRVVASRANAAILRGNPDVDGVEVLSPAGLPGLARQLLRRWDVVADLNTSPSLSSGLLARLARATERVSFAKKNAELFYDVRLPLDEKAHKAAETLALARRLGAEDGDLAYALYPSEEDERRAEEALREAGWAPGFVWVAVHPGNIKKFDNRWPEEKFGELCGRLRSLADVRVLLLQGYDEASLVAAVRRHCPAELAALPPLALLPTACVLRRMRLVVCNSTSTLHLAAAVGTPSLSFLSGYSWHCWRVLDGRHRALVSAEWDACRDITLESAWKAAEEMLHEDL